MIHYLRKLALTGLFTLLVVLAKAQVTESLQNQMRNARSDTALIRLYHQVTDTLYKTNQFDSMYSVAQKGIRLATKIRSNSQLAWFYYHMGQFYRKKGSFEKSLQFLKEAKVLFAQEKDTINLVKTMYGIAIVTFDQGDHQQGIAICLTNLEYFKKIRHLKFELHTYQLLSEIYSYLKNRQMKQFYLEKFFQRSQSTNDFGLQYNALCLKAQSYEDQGDFRKAWLYHKKLLALTRKSGRPTYIVNQLYDISHFLRKRHRLMEAYPYLEEGLKISNAIHDNSLKGHILQEMTLNQLKQGNHKVALKMAHEALKLRYDQGPVVQAGVMYNLAMVQEAAGHYKEALKTYKRYKTVVDSVLSSEKMEKIAQIQSRYDLKDKELAIQLLTRNAQLQKLKARQQEEKLSTASQQQFLLGIVAFMLVLLVVVISYFLYRARKIQKKLTLQKQEIELQAEQLKETNQQKDKLFSIISHDLRAPVASLKATFTMRQIRANTSSDWNTIEQEVNMLSHTLDNTLYWSLSQRNGIRVRFDQVYLADLVNDLVENFNGLINAKKLILTVHDTPVEVRLDENLTSLVLRNILHNAIKFTPAGGAISIRMLQTPSTYELQIKDTGIGMDLSKAGSLRPGPERGTGLGLTLSEEFMKLNGGQLLVESRVGQGTTVTLCWPKNGFS